MKRKKHKERIWKKLIIKEYQRNYREARKHLS